LEAHRQRIGDFAPIVVMAHEWGHHVQALLGLAPARGNTVELHADCLAGAYASDAGQRGLLDPGDITEAVAMSAAAGDPLGLPQDTPGAHGINDDRITAFMRGYLGGVDACALLEEGRSRGSDPEWPDADLRCHQPDETPSEGCFERAARECLLRRRAQRHHPTRVVDGPGAGVAAGGDMRHD
jgi:hypothetical protein